MWILQLAELGSEPEGTRLKPRNCTDFTFRFHLQEGVKSTLFDADFNVSILFGGGWFG